MLNEPSEHDYDAESDSGDDSVSNESDGDNPISEESRNTATESATNEALSERRASGTLERGTTSLTRSRAAALGKPMATLIENLEIQQRAYSLG